MNIVKRITQHRALRAEVRAWCADTRVRLDTLGQDPRTVAAPPDGYRAFPEAVELENQRTRALCKIKADEHDAIKEVAEKLRQARIAEPEYQQFLALCQIYPWELKHMSYMNQQWYMARLRDLAVDQTTRLIEEARQGDYEAYELVADLMRFDTDPHCAVRYSAITGSNFPTPSDWDDICARL